MDAVDEAASSKEQTMRGQTMQNTMDDPMVLEELDSKMKKQFENKLLKKLFLKENEKNK